jgi:hypothetical protein
VRRLALRGRLTNLPAPAELRHLTGRRLRRELRPEFRDRSVSKLRTAQWFAIEYGAGGDPGLPRRRGGDRRRR